MPKGETEGAMGTSADAKREKWVAAHTYWNEPSRVLFALGAMIAVASVPPASRGDYLYVPIAGGLTQVDAGGNVVPVYTPAGGAFYPQSISTDEKGQIFALQSGGQLFQLGGGQVTVRRVDDFDALLAADPSDNIYLYNANLVGVTKQAPNGTVVGYTNTGAAALAASAGGYLYVVDDGVRRFNPDGTGTQLLAEGEAEETLATDGAGNLYALVPSGATGSNTYSVVKVTPSGSTSTTVVGLMTQGAISADGAGNVFVSQTALGGNGDWIATIRQAEGGTLGRAIAMFDLGPPDPRFPDAVPVQDFIASGGLVDVPEPGLVGLPFSAFGLLYVRRNRRPG